MNVYRHTWLQSNFRQRFQSDDKTTSSQHKTLKWLGKWFLLGMLLGLVSQLSACTTQPQPPCEMQPVPMKPAQTEPAPSETFSKAAHRYFKTWQEKLIALPRIDKP